nr:MAG TPA: hypothetical protein [Caudoviricetes sp.]DAZ32416.1 MAG TPA: hypothetical protein [Caudoviricetes sp.]
MRLPRYHEIKHEVAISPPYSILAIPQSSRYNMYVVNGIG